MATENISYLKGFSLGLAVNNDKKTKGSFLNREKNYMTFASWTRLQPNYCKV
jgi:hypothetical protein